MGGELSLSDDRAFEMSGGRTANLSLHDLASGTLEGGLVQNRIGVYDDAALTIEGSHFEIDGVAVPYGAVVASSGILSDTLARGEDLRVVFEWATGASITLPEPGPVATPAAGLLALAMLRRGRRNRRPSAVASRERGDAPPAGGT